MATKEPKKTVKKPAKKAAPKATKVKAVKKAKVEKVKAEKPAKVAPKVEKAVEKEIIAPVVEAQEKVEKVEKVHPVKSSEAGISQGEIISRGKEKLGKYFYAVGRRKTSVAQIRLFENEKATDADLIVNGKKLKEYFPTASMQNNLFSPLKAVGMMGKFRMTAIVRGGGVTGQLEAVRLGIARALVKYNETWKKSLKDLGLMTRDSREVERKKAGLKKARKAPQWAKR